jgi:nucleotidyltransferase/DNA polymerase involved in DNA repair
MAHGRDDRTVTPDREAKSVSTETTFAQDIGDREVLRVWRWTWWTNSGLDYGPGCGRVE